MSVFQRVKEMLHIGEEEEDIEVIEIDNEEEVSETESRYTENVGNRSHSDRHSVIETPREKMKNNSNNNVVGFRGLNNNAEVMVIEPESFDDMPKVIDALRDRKSVVLNLEKMDAEKAQRSVDFVAGGTYAMDGHYERVGDNIFLFTPSCVTVSNLSGLITTVDDLSNARNRRPGNTPANHAVDYWAESATVAQ